MGCQVETSVVLAWSGEELFRLGRTMEAERLLFVVTSKSARARGCGGATDSASEFVAGVSEGDGARYIFPLDPRTRLRRASHCAHASSVRQKRPAEVPLKALFWNELMRAYPET